MKSPSAPRISAASAPPILPAHNNLLLLQYEYSGGKFGGDYNPLGACDNADLTSPTRPPPAPSSDAGAVYFGCFKDVLGQRTMGYEYQDTENLTNEVKSAGESFPHALLNRTSFLR